MNKLAGYSTGESQERILSPAEFIGLHATPIQSPAERIPPVVGLIPVVAARVLARVEGILPRATRIRPPAEFIPRPAAAIRSLVELIPPAAEPIPTLAERIWPQAEDVHEPTDGIPPLTGITPAPAESVRKSTERILPDPPAFYGSFCVFRLSSHNN